MSDTFDRFSASASTDARLVLIVDPSRHWAVGLASSFLRLKYAIRIATCVDSALHDFTVMAPSIVISEIELGGRSGIDFLRIVRERSSVPFAFVTCTPSLAMVSVAHQLRCDAYLTKPTTAAEILEMTGLQTQSQYNNQPPLTLQHATRQYVVRILQDAGTIAEAARRLHLHKRSLRRMLGNRNSAQDATGGEYGAPDSQKDG